MPTQSFPGAPRRCVSSFWGCAAAALLAGFLPAARARAQQPVTLPSRGDTLLVSLPDAVTRALTAGDEARLAEAQEDATDAQLTVARATALPSLRFTGG
jgi:outer membrane protein TolC